MGLPTLGSDGTRTHGHGTPPQWAYVAMFLVALVTLAVELLSTRVVSVLAIYHLAFFVLALALLGMTVGALLVYLYPRHFTPEFALGRYSELFSVSIPLSVGCMFALPIPGIHSLTDGLALGLLAFVISIPFVFSGILVSITLTGCGLPYGKIYAADLIGAACGSLLIIPALNHLSPGSIGLVLSALAMVASICYRGFRGTAAVRQAVVWVLAMVSFTYWNEASNAGIVITQAKATKIRPQELQFLGWNSHSFVTVKKAVNDQPLLWGPSPRMPKIRTTSAYLTIDGDAGSELTQLDANLDSMRWLLCDVTSLAYQLQTPRRAAIIGLGGGRDAVTALVAGAEEVVGIEVNSLIIELLRGEHVPALRSFVGLADHPRVRLVHDDARSFLTTSQERFDTIQMSLIDTWAASSAGAYTLTENGLYTVEAWLTFLDRLSDEGLFTVSRWYSREGLDETSRCVSTAAAACLRRGLTPVRQHIVLASSGRVATLIVSKQPFSQQTLAKLHDVCQQHQFELLLAPAEPPALAAGLICREPRKDPTLVPKNPTLARSAHTLDLNAAEENPTLVHQDPTLARSAHTLELNSAEESLGHAVAGKRHTGLELLHRLVACETEQQLASVCKAELLDVSPATDDRPYFFHQLKLSTLFQDHRWIGTFGGPSGNLQATATLLAIFVISIAGLVAGVFVPLRQVGRPRGMPARSFWAAVVYFSAIGLGFMLIEMSFVQKFSVLLGHPTYSLACVIASMILATGVGSLLSGRLPANNVRLFLGYPIVVVTVQLLAWVLLPWAFQATVTASLVTRILTTLAFTVPCGLVMGVCFPLGMALVERFDASATPWMWGINGAASVLGTVAAICVSILWGISCTLMLGIVCYGALLAANLVFLRSQATTSPA